MSTSSSRTKEIGREIIGNINEDGYLRASVEEIQQATEAKLRVDGDVPEMLAGH